MARAAPDTQQPRLAYLPGFIAPQDGRQLLATAAIFADAAVPAGAVAIAPAADLCVSRLHPPSRWCAATARLSGHAESVAESRRLRAERPGYRLLHRDAYASDRSWWARAGSGEGCLQGRGGDWALVPEPGLRNERCRSSGGWDAVYLFAHIPGDLSRIRKRPWAQRRKEEPRRRRDICLHRARIIQPAFHHAIKPVPTSRALASINADFRERMTTVTDGPTERQTVDARPALSSRGTDSSSANPTNQPIPRHRTEPRYTNPKRRIYSCWNAHASRSEPPSCWRLGGRAGPAEVR
jgi:hypothetical protein